MTQRDTKLGWSLPPGVTNQQIEEAAGVDGEPCECCGRDVDECICEVCPRCHESGNPDCYDGTCVTHEPCPKCFEGECTHSPGMSCPPPKLRYTRDQRMGQTKLRIAELDQKIADEDLYMAHLESLPEDWRDE